MKKSLFAAFLLWMLAFSGSYIQPNRVTAAEPPPVCPVNWLSTEEQSWWQNPGEPDQKGHIHLSTCNPVNNLIVNGSYTFNLRIELHEQPSDAVITRVRLKDYPGGVDRWVGSKPYPTIDSNGNLVTNFSVPINFSNLTSGRHEFRWGVYVSVKGIVQLLSTRLQVCIRSCSPAYRSLSTYPFLQGNGSWYKNDTIGYVDARMRSSLPLSSVVGWAPTIQCANPSGQPVTRTLVAIDSRIHDGDQGNIIFTYAGAIKKTLPAIQTSSGWHRLVVRCEALTSLGKNTSIFVTPFLVP
jgi:hypothetical protein